MGLNGDRMEGSWSKKGRAFDILWKGLKKNLNATTQIQMRLPAPTNIFYFNQIKFGSWESKPLFAYSSLFVGRLQSSSMTRSTPIQAVIALKTIHTGMVRNVSNAKDKNSGMKTLRPAKPALPLLYMIGLTISVFVPHRLPTSRMGAV